ncbi:MAG: methyltransferase domain-containing protein, partial [Verrucomicrobiota bacterium]
DLVPVDEVSGQFDEYRSCDLERSEDLDFDRRFDVVLLADVLEHVRNGRQLIRDAGRLGKPGARIIVSVPNIAIWFYRLSLLVGRFNYGPKGTLDETHVRFYTLDTIREAMRAGGLQVCSERVTGLPFEVVFESTGRSRMIRLLDRGYFLLARAWPRLFAYQLIVGAVSREVTSGPVLRAPRS